MVGSSPHTRGTHGVCDGQKRVLRLIPAHAGNSTKSSWPSAPFSAHPRTRGELTHCPQTEVVERGSSPHTRGTLPDLKLKRRLRRLIPAHAGNSP